MVGRLNRRAIFDPRFTKAFAVVQEGSMTSSVLIRRPVPGDAKPAHNFDSGIRPTANRYTELFRGQGRVVPNKDWRARGYEFGDESTVFQAVRIDVPLVGGEWLATSLPREFRDEDQVIIEANFEGYKGLDPLLRYLFIVRNPISSGVAGQQNLLCDVDLKGGLAVGN